MLRKPMLGVVGPHRHHAMRAADDLETHPVVPAQNIPRGSNTVPSRRSMTGNCVNVRSSITGSPPGARYSLRSARRLRMKPLRLLRSALPAPPTSQLGVDQLPHAERARPRKRSSATKTSRSSVTSSVQDRNCSRRQLPQVQSRPRRGSCTAKHASATTNHRMRRLANFGESSLPLRISRRAKRKPLARGWSGDQAAVLQGLRLVTPAGLTWTRRLPLA